jgi:hypothetical protein
MTGKEIKVSGHHCTSDVLLCQLFKGCLSLACCALLFNARLILISDGNDRLAGSRHGARWVII